MSRMFEKSLFPLLVLMAGTLFSCQRKAEEPVVSPGAGRGQVWFEVSERPMGGETKAAPATKETFTSLYESFGVVGYAYASDSPSTKNIDASGTMEVSYVIDRDRWEPATPVKYSFAGNSLEFYAWYPYNTTTVPVTAPSSITASEHPTITYTVPPAVADQKDLMVAVKTEVTDSPSTDAPVQLTFSHKLTAVKFSIGVGTTCSSITLEGIFGQGTLDMTNDYWLPPVGTADSTYTITSPTFGSADDNGQRLIDEAYTLMLIPQTLPAGATLTAVTSAGNFTVSLAGQEWEPGKEVTYKLTDPAASFSVSATKKVRFSRGNLQYQASTGNWRFAAHQWNYVGSDNSQISDSYSGWIDLFGWGTSGHVFPAGTYGSAYQPWSTSNTSTEYGPRYSHLTGDYADGDWGVNMGSGWRTLTSSEWYWLLGLDSSPHPGGDCRTSSTVGVTANARFAKAYLFGSVHGLIIFPDVYTHPDGVPLPNGINAFNSTSWDSNQYTEDEWTMMESAGCVFLPAAGMRNGRTVSGLGSCGYYWASTNNSAPFSAYALYFISNNLYRSECSRHYGCSVRLVQDLP